MSRRPDQERELAEKLEQARKEGRYEAGPSFGAYENIYSSRIIAESAPATHPKIRVGGAGIIIAGPRERYDVGHHVRVFAENPSGIPGTIGSAKRHSEDLKSTPAGTESEMSGENRVTREEIDAKLDAMTSRVEASEARIASSLDLIHAELAHVAAGVKDKPGLGALVITVASGIAVALGIVIGLLSFAGDRFDGGIAVSSATAQQAAQTQLQSEENASALDTLTKIAVSQQQQLQRQNEQLETLLSRLPSDSPDADAPTVP